MHILWCMGSKFCVKFRRAPLKFHTKFWTHTLQNMHFTVFYFCMWVMISCNCDFISISETDSWKLRTEVGGSHRTSKAGWARDTAWWHHDIEEQSVLLNLCAEKPSWYGTMFLALCAGNHQLLVDSQHKGPVTSGFLHKGPVMQSFDDLLLWTTFWTNT